MLINFRFLIPLCIAALGSQLATAHPHVWITANAELMFDRNNRLVAIKHQWQFDDAFSAYATVGLDKNGDGKYSRRELAKLARINIESIADFQYFTFVQMGEFEPDYSPATDYWLEYEDGRLQLFYTLPMAEPVEPNPVSGFGELTIEIFDPMFFADVAFNKADPIAINGPDHVAQNCSARLAHPQQLDEAQKQQLAEIGPAEDIPADLSPDISYLASTITLNCVAS